MMYSNNILNFQESTTVLNGRTKKSVNLLKALRMCASVCVMDSPVNLDVCGLNSSIKDMNCWITYIGDLFIVVKVHVEAGKLLR